MSRSKALIFAELLAAVLVWGSSFAATKIALREVSPVTVVGGIVILAGVWLVNRRDVPSLYEDPALAPGGEGGPQHHD
ncbi:MAG: DMT family transporter [Thermoanaerobaculaceae bacterium]|jgi:drug/metabolite transporter (DMT)-like permease|nr:DMT family transporter [Thermoanaerobaculaceae bacterium]